MSNSPRRHSCTKSIHPRAPTKSSFALSILSRNSGSKNDRGKKSTIYANPVYEFRFLKVAVAVLLFVVTAQAGTGYNDSPSIRVDTRGSVPVITVTMHRAPPGMFANAGPGAGIDDALQIKGAALAALLPNSIIQGQVLANNDPGIYISDPQGGLVADGVTPLVFKITAPANSLPAEGTTYELSVKSVGYGTYSGSGGLSPLLSIVSGGYVKVRPSFRLTPSDPTAYAILAPVAPEKLNTTYLSSFFRPAVADLEVRELGHTERLSVFRFGIRKPPIALVHGYNVKNKDGWGASFKNKLEMDRGTDFVIQVGYGLEKDANTIDPFLKLAVTLDGELRTQVEEASVLRNWAFTRYDAVGHSQGGVLLRMLCSRNVASAGFVAFRNADNANRGRFRRVVTIGSPHAGSTLAEMGSQLLALNVEFGGLTGFLNSENPKSKLYFARLFQPKFRIGTGSELDTINNALQCDPFARLHLIRTTIYGGLAPGANGQYWNPSYYNALYLNRPTPLVGGQRPGLVVAPNGADGVVDVDSQEAGAGNNHTSAIEAGEDIIHADIPGLPDEVPDTESSTVAQRVKALLDGPPSGFGPVTIPAGLTAAMNLRAASISLLVQAIKDSQTNVPAHCFLPTAPSSLAPSALKRMPLGNAALSDEILQFTLQPPSGESPNGTVEWMVVVYGPAGSNASPALLTSGTYGEQLAVTIPASLRGQVVLSVRFPSASGKTVLGSPQVVLNRPPGAVLTSIELNPTSIQSQIGAEVALNMSGIYDGVTPGDLFTNAENCVFQSSNAGVATVDTNGHVKLLALGTATITATYNGTLTTTTPVTVLDVAPIITSAANVTGTVGQTFSHQLTASQVAQSFSSATLPSGLMLNPQTGLITGTPTMQGANSALISVGNTNGKSTKQVDFRISGPAVAPTDIGLNVTALSENKPSGTAVGQFSTTDPNPLESFSYQLASGTGATNNALFIITDNELSTAAVLNHTTQPSVSIRVRSTDSSGLSFEKVIVLPVLAPPAVTRQPSPREVFVGEDALFFVETTGVEPLSYQWLKDGEAIPNANSRILQLASVALTDAGNYAVTVSNSDGSATSSTAVLVVDPVSYGKWASTLPQIYTTAVLAPTGDYNADGIPNLLEYGLGSNPESFASTALPVVGRLGNFMTLTFTRARSEMNYVVEGSSDFGSWSTIATNPGTVGQNVTVTDTVDITTAGSLRRFLRLRVTAP
ncbi:MAG: Ig-like domain-containing protein [Burkholderiales bacterium]|nr:Ig-like domain-containing protein [Opitutaceae bacterium]